MATSTAKTVWLNRFAARASAAWLTCAVAVSTLAVSITALVQPALMPEMTRNLAQLQAGQWWRLVTPVLVQPDGWGQLVFNVLGIAVGGAELERRASRGAWAVTYLLGGIAGVVTAGSWQPADHGGGSSDAVAALIGALCVLIVAEGHDRPGHPPRPGWPAQLYCVFFAGYLTALDVGGVWPSILVGDATIAAFVVARRALRPAALTRASLLFVLAAGAAMVLERDGHGVGIVVGATIALLIMLRRKVNRARGGLLPPTRAPWRRRSGAGRWQ